jgi:site-specific recombinase XerD
MIKQTRLLSTVDAYQHRLKRFSKWCKERKTRPTQPSVKDLFDFIVQSMSKLRKWLSMSKLMKKMNGYGWFIGSAVRLLGLDTA